MDVIEIKGLRVFGRHGVLEQERHDGQTFVVDLAVGIDLAAAAASDELNGSLDYAGLAERVAQAVAGTRFNLIETLADHLARVVLAQPGAAAVTVRVAKPQAPMDVDVDEVAVVLHRERT